LLVLVIIGQADGRRLSVKLVRIQSKRIGSFGAPTFSTNLLALGNDAG
jgi:hypothetical protein